MPAVTIYSVDFANGNLAPFLDQDSWGSMVQGHSPAETLHSFSSYPVADEGLHLDLSRSGGTAFASNGVYVIPPTPPPLAARLLLRAEFDSPFGSTPHPKNVEAGPEPWAIALKVKMRGEASDVISDTALIA